MYYNFNPKLKEPLNLIHPLQVKKVQQLLDQQFPEYIKYIIVFGSSLDLTHSVESDLDFYVIYSDELDDDEAYGIIRELFKPLKKIDLLVATQEQFLSNLNSLGTVENRMLEKGVFIYAKK